jgi:hypothetical protein
MAAPKKRSGGAKDAKPSEDIPGDCLKAANLIKASMEHGDDFQSAVQKLAEYAETLAKATEAIHAKQAAVDLASRAVEFEKYLKSAKTAEGGTEDSAMEMKRAVDKLYAPFAEARQTAYGLAAAWGIDVAGHSAGKSKKSSDVKSMSEGELVSGIDWAAKNLVTNIKDFLEKGAKAQKMLREAAKKLGLEKGELTQSEKQAIINACLDFKMSADPLYGRTRGIARRAEEILARARELEKYEAKAKRLKIEFAFDDDPEIGEMEFI